MPTKYVKRHDIQAGTVKVIELSDGSFTAMFNDFSGCATSRKAALTDLAEQLRDASGEVFGLAGKAR